MQSVIKDYLEASKPLDSDIEKMTSEGFSKENISIFNKIKDSTLIKEFMNEMNKFRKL